jgi:hypothetical protein
MNMNLFQSFIKKASQMHSNDDSLPEDYMAIRAATISRFPKLASALPIAGAELAGLGILAKPSINDLRNPQASPEDKRKAKYETAGLGLLGVHPAYQLGSAGVNQLRRWAVTSKLRNAAKGFKIPQLG